TVDNAHSRSTSLLIIIDDGMHHRIGTYRKVTRLHCPGQRGRVAAEICTVHTPPITHRLIHTLRTPLLGVDWLGIGDVCATRLDEMSIVVVFLQAFQEVLFNATHFKARHAFAVREFRKSIAVAGDASKLFYVRVPGLKVFITYGPIDSKAIARGTFKIKITPSLCLPCPQQ